MTTIHDLNRQMYERQARARELLPQVEFVRLPDASYRAKDCHNYEVRVGDVVIGKVEAYRSESWGTNRSGKIRTHYLGNPKYWEPVPVRTTPGHTRRRVGQETRQRATQELIELALMAGLIK